ncbi:hypothetical protein MICRO80W_10020 [Micrococcus luteus]|nr:hypothetical protein MICRO80W_10020 [Micrococcus luteus]
MKSPAGTINRHPGDQTTLVAGVRRGQTGARGSRTPVGARDGRPQDDRGCPPSVHNPVDNR